jgi:SAM-dependent methyltransferase
VGEIIERIACPVCEKQQARLLRVGIREDSSRPVYICSHCRLQFIEPPFSDLKGYYQHEYRKIHDAVPGSRLSVEERFTIQQAHMLQTSKNVMEHFPEGGSVLEIGCSTGGLLSHLTEKYELFGNEWNPEDAAYVRDVGEIPCEEGDLPDIYPDKKFTAIIACAVLEHVPNPREWLLQVRDKLIGGGWLYIETPSVNDAMVSVYQIPSYANFWYREPHITYWPADLLADVVSHCGMEARVTQYQRYGLLNHMSWFNTGAPMQDPMAARQYFKPVHPKHPLAPMDNRHWLAADRSYRLHRECTLSADTLKCLARRREI